jgi:hypothetical protein
VGAAQVPLVAQEAPASPAEPDELPDAAASGLPDDEPLPPASLGVALPLEDVLASSPGPALLPDEAPELLPEPPSGSEIEVLPPEPPHPIPIAMTSEAEANPVETRIESPTRLAEQNVRSGPSPPFRSVPRPPESQAMGGSIDLDLA